MQSQRLKHYLAILGIAGLLGSSVMFAQSQKTTPPRPIHTVVAEYPHTALSSGVEGTVSVMLTIPPDGVPKEVKVAKGLRPDFDQSALDAVRQWRFRPAIRNGKPIEVTVTLQVAFKVHDLR